MSVYIMSDPHFGHRNVIKFRRQFNTVDDHDDFLLNNILQFSGKRNTLFILGDYIFDENKLWIAEQIHNSFENVKLILGNHDTEGKRYRRIVLPMIQNGWVDSVHGLLKYKKTWLSHAPIHPNQLRGALNVHGHVHSESLEDKRYINVSMDVINFKPAIYESLFK